MAAFASGDATMVGALYTSDCKVMPTGADVVNGPAGKSHIISSRYAFINYKL